MLYAQLTRLSLPVSEGRGARDFRSAVCMSRCSGAHHHMMMAPYGDSDGSLSRTGHVAWVSMGAGGSLGAAPMPALPLAATQGPLVRVEVRCPSHWHISNLLSFFLFKIPITLGTAGGLPGTFTLKRPGPLARGWRKGSSYGSTHSGGLSVVRTRCL